MLQQIVNLITLVATIAKLDPDDYDEVNAKVEQYETEKAAIKQFNGDHDLAKPEVLGALDKVVEAARVSSHPGDDEAEAIIAEQDEAKGTTGVGETQPATAQELMDANSKDQLLSIAKAEDIDLGDASTKPQIAEKIVQVRMEKAGATGGQ